MTHPFKSRVGRPAVLLRSCLETGSSMTIIKRFPHFSQRSPYLGFPFFCPFSLTHFFCIFGISTPVGGFYRVIAATLGHADVPPLRGWGLV